MENQKNLKKAKMFLLLSILLILFIAFFIDDLHFFINKNDIFKNCINDELQMIRNFDTFILHENGSEEFVQEGEIFTAVKSEEDCEKIANEDFVQKKIKFLELSTFNKISKKFYFLFVHWYILLILLIFFFFAFYYSYSKRFLKK